MHLRRRHAMRESALSVWPGEERRGSASRRIEPHTAPHVHLHHAQAQQQVPVIGDAEHFHQITCDAQRCGGLAICGRFAQVGDAMPRAQRRDEHGSDSGEGTDEDERSVRRPVSLSE